MPRRPDIPCAGCGKLIWRGRGVLPPGQATCRQCRAIATRPYGGRSGSQVPPRFRSKVCVQCGSGFSPPTTGNYRRKTCSEFCALLAMGADPTAPRSSKVRSSRRRVLLRQAVRERYTLAEIAARDGFRCGLCHKRVRMTLKAPHRMSPTVDHLVPISVGGDDVKANVQLAHYGCNSRRGAGGVVQLALIG